MGNGELILVKYDEAAVRELAKNVLETFGYRALVASDGAEAMALCRSAGVRFRWW